MEDQPSNQSNRPKDGNKDSKESFTLNNLSRRCIINIGEKPACPLKLMHGWIKFQMVKILDGSFKMVGGAGWKVSRGGQVLGQPQVT